MALFREKESKRLHAESRFMGESLVSESLLDELEVPEQKRLFPDVAVLKIGGQSICDQGENGLERGNITRALKGEHVGTVIYRD